MTMNRCHWANPKNPLYIEYHDFEWGIPEHDDHKLFEMLVLESFQAGLSWECVLNKREAFRENFDNFDVEKVSEYSEEKIYELTANKSIIRNKLKIKAAVNNASRFIEIQKESGSFDKYLWSFCRRFLQIEDNSPEPLIQENTLTKSALSDALSKDLQKRGMKFVGSTIIYSLLQAIGVIDSHEDECDFHNIICPSHHGLGCDSR